VVPDVSKEPVGFIVKVQEKRILHGRSFETSGNTHSVTQKTRILPHTDVKTSHLVTRNCERLLSPFNVKTIVRDDDPASLLLDKFVVFRLGILSPDDGMVKPAAMHK